MRSAEPKIFAVMENDPVESVRSKPSPRRRLADTTGRPVTASMTLPLTVVDCAGAGGAGCCTARRFWAIAGTVKTSAAIATADFQLTVLLGFMSLLSNSELRRLEAPRSFGMVT